MNMPSNDRVAVVIPTRNEEATVAGVIRSVRPFASDIVVYDGHSTDRTREIAAAEGARVVVQNGAGKGTAIRQAFSDIAKDVIVLIDADGSHESADIPKLVAPLLDGRADLVVASRLLGGSDELHGSWNNFVRMAGSSLLAVGINARWRTSLTDIENGFRAVRRDAALKLGLTASGFIIEQEMVMKAVKKGFRVMEVASHEYERKGGVSKLPTRQGWKFVLRYLIDLW